MLTDFIHDIDENIVERAKSDNAYRNVANVQIK